MLVWFSAYNGRSQCYIQILGLYQEASAIWMPCLIWFSNALPWLPCCHVQRRQQGWELGHLLNLWGLANLPGSIMQQDLVCIISRSVMFAVPASSGSLGLTSGSTHPMQPSICTVSTTSTGSATNTWHFAGICPSLSRVPVWAVSATHMSPVISWQTVKCSGHVIMCTHHHPHTRTRCLGKQLHHSPRLQLQILQV